jgi:predicted TPR repeat methyltransferase
MEIKEENRTEFEMHNGFAQDSISTKYDELCSNYEEVYTSVGWPDPDQCAQLCVDNGYDENSHVLDMGSGTGLVAQYLKDKTGHENSNIIGIDASDGMIKKAEEKGLYKDIR